MRVTGWNTPNPKATLQEARQLAEQRYAEHRSAGMDDQKARQAVAEDVTHYLFPHRQDLYTAGTVSWAEQVAEATRLSKKADDAEQPPLFQSPPMPGIGYPAATQSPTGSPIPGSMAAPPGPPSMPPMTWGSDAGPQSWRPAGPGPVPAPMGETPAGPPEPDVAPPGGPMPPIMGGP